MGMEFRILGPVEALSADGRLLVSGTGKVPELLALLLLRPDELVPAARVIDDLWDGVAPRTAGKAVQTYVSQLRRALGEDVIETRPGGYVLVASSHELDSARFEAHVADGTAAAERGDPQAASASLRAALRLWRGPALGALASRPWARAEAERLEQERVRALEARIEADLALGAHRDVVAELERLTAEHPAREHLLALLMLALYRSGRQADALAACRQARGYLADELGIDVSDEIADLEVRILRHDPELAGPAARPAIRPALRPVITSPTRHRALSALPRRRARIWIAGGVAAALALGALVVTAIAGPGSRLAQADELVSVGPDGQPGLQIPVGAAPAHVARGGGYLWASNEVDGTVSRVQTNGGAVTVIPVGPDPQGLAFASGELWVAVGGSNLIAVVDPAAAKVVLTVQVGNGPVSLATHGDLLWVANSVDGTLSTVDPASGRVIRTVPVGPDPTAVVASAGALWVSLAGSGAVAELDPAGSQVIATVSVGGDPSALAVAGGGVWVANTIDDNIARVSTVTGTVDALLPLPAAPTALASSHGTIWVTLADGRLARIDIASRRLVAMSAVGASPAAVVADGRAAWVTTLPAPQAHRGGTLRVQAGPMSVCNCADPALAFDPAEWQFLSLVYEGLVAYRHVGGPAGSSLVGDLAQAIPSPTDGGRTYVFRLRQGVRFSSGQLVRASDVRSSIDRLLRINHATLLPIYFHIGSVVADNRSATVTFHLTAPDPDFLYALALPFAAIVPASSPLAISTSPLPGTGPYQITAFVPGSRLVLTRNPWFRVFSLQGAPDGYPDRIVATLAATVPAQVASVERGASDVVSAWRLPLGIISTLTRRYASRFHADSYGATEFFFLNTTVAPFSNLDAREAINQAVDRNRLVALSGGPDVAHATCQVLPPGFPGYIPYCPYGLHPSSAGAWTGPNLRKALALVAASGTRGEPVAVWAPGFRAAQAGYIAGILRRLGYRARLHIFASEAAYYNDVTGARRAQIGWVGWLRDYTSAANFMVPIFSCPTAANPAGQGANFSRLCDARLERLISAAQGVQSQDLVAALRAWAAADHMVADQAAVLPYENPLALTLLSRRTGNYQFNPEWGVLLDQLWVR